jgi:ABC-type multidrug transport system fused ATPase/permease subunit
VKSKTVEKKIALDFRHLLDGLIERSVRMLKVSLIAQPILQILKYLTLGAIFIYGSWMLSNNHFSFGNLTVFLGTTYLFFNTLNALGNTYGRLRENLARMEVVYSILDNPPENYERKTATTVPLIISSFEFRDVSFGYNASHPVLKKISIIVSRGEILGITGQSGSGKTTLIRLLVRFYEPDGGEIWINNRSIDQVDLMGLRSATGIVFQENLILNDTIKKNIAFGHNDIPLKRIMQAAMDAHAHDFIKRLPQQYDTVVGERGKLLSGGERQRLAIARALISNPDILILDEGTSFLEMEQEQAVLTTIKKIRKDKITVIISHRLSAIRMAERVVMIDNGRILETGLPSMAEFGLDD